MTHQETAAPPPFRVDLPSFVREAWEDSSAPPLGPGPEIMETLADFSDLFAPDPASLGLWARLEETVQKGPLRYAPFFDELGALFDLDDGGLSAELERALAPAGWTLTPFSGVRLFRVRCGSTLGGREAYLVKLAKNARIPRHRHPGEEVTLVLEGGYREDSGREFHAGDLSRALGGADYHSLEVIGGEPCVIALQLEKRFVFESAFYRAFLNAFWR